MKISASSQTEYFKAQLRAFSRIPPSCATWRNWRFPSIPFRGSVHLVKGLQFNSTTKPINCAKKNINKGKIPTCTYYLLEQLNNLRKCIGLTRIGDFAHFVPKGCELSSVYRLHQKFSFTFSKRYFWCC